MGQQFVSWNTFYNDAIIGNIAPDVSKKYRSGIERRLKSYVEQKYSDYISHDDNGEILVCRSLLDKANGLKDYFQYSEGIDYSAEDIAKRLLIHIGIPPIDTMSLESVEKKVRDLFDLPAYKDSVYAKRSSKKSGHSICCVDLATIHRIENDKNIIGLIRKQLKKAEQRGKGSDSVGWKCYEQEKSFIRFRDEQAHVQQSEQTIFPDDIPSLSWQEKSFYMTQALFSVFFTEFDFDLFNKDIAEYNLLETAMNFGERYQELEEIFGAPHFNWRYYRIKEIEGAVLDRLAGKIATAILNQRKEKEG